jgi:anti-sigma regulatory factor (Ser/Thr protein kinase)
MRRAFPRNLESLSPLYEFAEGIFETNDISSDVRFPVHLAMEELFVNMVKYNPDVPTDITVEVTVTFLGEVTNDAASSKEVTVTLVDDGGVEFDVTAKRQVNIDAPLEERTPGGLGIHLIQNLADRLEYTYKDGRGKVIFTKGSGNKDV